MNELSEAGIPTWVSLVPVLLFIEDIAENIGSIIKMTAESGGSYIIPAFGVTLRDRQREYFYKKLDELFPEQNLREIHKTVWRIL